MGVPRIFRLFRLFNFVVANDRPILQVYDYKHGDQYRGPRTASFATSSLKRSHTLMLSFFVWLPLVSVTAPKS